MKKPLFNGFTREIFVVSFDENGKRVERDFDLLPEEEKHRLRCKNNRRAVMAAGYRPVSEQMAAE